MKIFKMRSKKKNNKSLIPFRLNLLFFIVFLLFAALVAQLAYLQIVYGGKFQAEVERTDKSTITGNVPRGMIYDSKGRIVVGNETKNAISFTKSAGIGTQQMLKTANKLSGLIFMNTDDLTERDMADYFLSNGDNYQKVLSEMPKKMKANNNEKLDDSVIYENALKFVKQKKLVKLTEKQKIAAAILKKMSSAYSLSTVFIKNDGITPEEVAKVGEHLTELPGIRLGSDWSREYPEGDSIKEIVGSVSSEKQGLPENQLQELLAKGYSRNERVGTSYLEKSYESILSGTKSQTQIELNSKDQVTNSKTIYPGSKGSNLKLTIDSQYQAAVEDVLRQTYESASGATQYSDGAYAVAMNPNTGEVLAIAGISNDPESGKEINDALGVINRTFVMGSAIKGATVLGGMMEGVITPTNNTLPDNPIQLPGSPIKKSVYPIGTYGALDAASALEVSSNNYMMGLVMKMAHARYVPGSFIKADDDIFTKMRSYYNQFGLGVKTGIDLPGEASGIEGSEFTADGNLKIGSALDLSYGNYDSYTLIQMAQYISAIANGGYRMKPYIVKSIEDTSNDGKTTNALYNSNPTVLNKIPVTPDQLKVVRQGMYQVTHGKKAWTTATSLGKLTPSVSGKTGTAQSFYYDPKNPTNPKPPETITTSFVGFAPSDKPEIAVAIVFPNLTSERGGFNLTVAKGMFEKYFEIYGKK